MGEEGVERLAVLTALAPRAADDGANDEWDVHLAARRVAVRANHIDELIHRQQEKVDPHVDVDGALSVEGGAEGETRHRIFAGGRVEAAVLAEALEDSRRRPEAVRVIRHADAEGDDRGV